MRTLHHRVSLGLAAAVLGWLTMLTVVLVVLRDSPQSGAIIMLLGASWMIIGLIQFVMLVRLKWRLEDVAPEVISDRRIGSLLWGFNSYRVVGATQDERVWGNPQLAPLAAALAGIELGALSWFGCAFLTILGLILGTAVGGGNGGVLLALALVLMPGAAMATLAYKAYKG